MVEKVIAKYLGWEYFPFNDLKCAPKAGWYSPLKFSELKGNWYTIEGKPHKYVGRKINKQTFAGDLELLFSIIAKIEDEDLKEYFYAWCDGDEQRFNFCGFEFTIFHGKIDMEIHLELDPSILISSKKVDYLNLGESLVELIFETIEYINDTRNSSNN